MLGSVKPKAGWIWCAGGKHPAAKDFIKIGPRQPLLQALIDWVAAGFMQMSRGGKVSFSNNSWRFWAGGNRRSNIICGVMRDSCDSFGRSFPLTVLGSGPLKDREDHWELLPLVLDKTWQQIEYLATRSRLAINQLEHEIHMLPVPTNNWSELYSAGQLPELDDAVFGNSPEVDRANRPHVTPGGSDPLLEIIPLANVSQADPPVQIAGLQAMLKIRLGRAPKAVFMGGIPEKSCLVVFKRPLRPDDFTKLWSLCSEEGAGPPNA
jgi:type VI secretion system ImpM family protein